MLNSMPISIVGVDDPFHFLVQLLVIPCLSLDFLKTLVMEKNLNHCTHPKLQLSMTVIQQSQSFKLYMQLMKS